MEDLKRFKQLLESKLGDVKPLITEQVVDVPEKDVNGKPFPPCVINWGWKAQLSSDKGYYSIIGGKTTSNYVDFTGYRLYSNYRTKNPDGQMEYYFCKGKFPTLGQKAEVSKKGVSTTTDLLGKVLKVGGPSGDVVKRVQNAILKGEHGDAVAVGGSEACKTDWQKCEGIYNQATKNAVISFQKSAGVTADGVVGDETWQQLFGGENTADRIKPKSTFGNTGVRTQFFRRVD